MPNGISVTGTPITNQLGQGSISGNAISISGLTLSPSLPGFNLSSAQVGPGYAYGQWTSGVEGRSGGGGGVIGGVAPGPGAGGGSGGGGALGYDEFGNEIVDLKPGISSSGWLFLGLIAYLLLKGK